MRSCAVARTLAPRLRRLATATLLRALAVLALARAQTCPSSCSGNGLCDTGASLTCRCYEGWTGHDCSLRACPSGAAWVGFGLAPDGSDVHARRAECSGVGDCDSTSGACVCRAGFAGNACERLAVCPAACSGGAGQCVSLRAAAAGYDGWLYTGGPRGYAGWDADRVFGCRCDEARTGGGCEALACPAGDDPLTPGVPEVQTLTCVCPGGCAGGLAALKLGDRAAAVLPSAVAARAQESAAAPAGSGSAPGESVESVLARLRPRAPTIASVVFQFGATALCSAAGTTAVVTFALAAGDAPPIDFSAGSVAAAANAAVVAYAATTVDGTGERAECSNRGYCSGGECTCVEGFFASDGSGGAGAARDCGSTTDARTGVTTPTAACPGAGCSGQGVCSGAPTWTCACFAGRSGPGCEKVDCPLGRAWFDRPAADGTAHALAPCSNAGACNRVDGTCACYDGFTGAACQRLACPTADAAAVCSGTGRCLTLREMVAAGSFGGELVGDEEVQAVTCSLTAGSFTLAHRGYATIPISFSASPAALRAALMALPSIGLVDVRVQPFTAATVCSSGAGTTTTVAFKTDLGDQPLLVAADGETGAWTPSVVVAELTRGSRPAYGDDVGGGAQWDADAVTGCVCDGYGYTNATDAEAGDGAAWAGVGCTFRACPFGVNPSTGRAATRVLAREVQRLSCSAPSGNFTLAFRKDTTRPLRATATAEELVAALQELRSVGLVAVAPVSGWVPAGGVCAPPSAGAPAVTDVAFVTELGDVPLLKADGYFLDAPAALLVEERVKGVGAPTECSGKGACSSDLGLCVCDKYWSSSDGMGNPGRRADCGSYNVEGRFITVG